MITRPNLSAFLLSSLVVTFGWGASSSAMAQGRPLFTRGHADVLVEYDASSDELDVNWLFEGALVGGQILGDDHDHGYHDGAEERPIDFARIATSATFVRPSSSAFEPIGVGAGQSVFYLPKSEGEADQAGVPFLGWEFESPAGIFVGNRAQLRLVAATSASGQPVDVAVWDEGDFAPVFFMSSADGLTSADAIDIGEHAHYQISLGATTNPGPVALEFEARAEKVDGSVLTKTFVLAAQTCTGSCRSTPAPALGGLGGFGLALGLGVVSLVARRREGGPAHA